MRYWPDGAPVVERCRCGGDLMLVEDAGPTVPVEVQCRECLELTGLAHDAVKVGAGGTTPITPGSPEDLGF